jgi:hypothetical protein
MAARPPLPDPPHVGGCLCGGVRYRLDARPLSVNACHCRDCKKLTGATNLLMLLASRSAFSHEGATASYRKRADSGREIDIFRCAVCGVRLWHEPLTAPELVFIAAGTLDDPSWALPTTHIWVEQASPLIALEPDTLQLVGQPKDRAALFDAFDKAYPK